MSAELKAPRMKNGSIAFSLPDAYRRQPALEALRLAFAHQQYIPLPGLLTGEALAQVKAEVSRLMEFGQPKDFIMPGYGTLRMMTTVGGQAIRRESDLLTELYEHDELRRLLGKIVGTPVYSCNDMNEWMVATILHAEGNTHGWHLDDPPLALVLFLEAPSPEQGGQLEFVRDWRHLCSEIGIEPENQVEDVVEKCRAAGLVEAKHHAAGDAYLLRADQSLHRVMPLVVAGARRMILNMAFELIPNIQRKGVTAELLFED